MNVHSCRINFYKACRLVFDNATEALREACKEEMIICTGYSPRKNLEDLDFSRLADYLVTPNRTSDSPNKLGSFYYSGFSAKHETDPEDPNCVLLTVSGKKDDRLEGINVPKGTKVCVNKELSPIEQISDDRFILRRSLSKNKRPKGLLEVFFQTEKCEAVYKLKTLRNDKIGHPVNTRITDGELSQMFQSARSAYQLMDVYSKDIEEELHEIEEGTDTCTDYNC